MSMQEGFEAKNDVERNNLDLRVIKVRLAGFFLFSTPLLTAIALYVTFQRSS